MCDLLNEISAPVNKPSKHQTASLHCRRSSATTPSTTTPPGETCKSALVHGIGLGLGLLRVRIHDRLINGEDEAGSLRSGTDCIALHEKRFPDKAFVSVADAFIFDIDTEPFATLVVLSSKLVQNVRGVIPELSQKNQQQANTGRLTNAPCIIAKLLGNDFKSFGKCIDNQLLLSWAK